VAAAGVGLLLHTACACLLSAHAASHLHISAYVGIGYRKYRHETGGVAAKAGGENISIKSGVK